MSPGGAIPETDSAGQDTKTPGARATLQARTPSTSFASKEIGCDAFGPPEIIDQYSASIDGVGPRQCICCRRAAQPWTEMKGAEVVVKKLPSLGPKSTPAAPR